MLPGKWLLMIGVEQQGCVDDCGMGQLQHSLSGSMMFTKGEWLLVQVYASIFCCCVDAGHVGSQLEQQAV
jgi:hypothetical protein